MEATAELVQFGTRRMRSGQVVAVGDARTLEAARVARTRVTLTDPAGHRATARISALGRSFVPGGARTPLAYGYLVDVEIEEGL